MSLASRKLIVLSLLFVSSVAPVCQAIQSQDTTVLVESGSVEAVTSILSAGAFSRLKGLGFSNSNALTFKMRGHTYRTKPLEVEAGQTYIILGGCDSKCNDIDLELFTSDKVLIELDTLKDSYPILHYVAEKTGSLILKISVEQCNAETCWGGVIIMKKATAKTSVANKALE